MPTAPPTHRSAGWKPRVPYANSRTAAKRITGRALQTRNDRIKLRDKYTCQMCGQITTEGQVDHRVPLAQGGLEGDDNLQWLCIEPCHAEKSKRERQGSTWNHRKGWAK